MPPWTRKCLSLLSKFFVPGALWLCTFFLFDLIFLQFIHGLCFRFLNHIANNPLLLVSLTWAILVLSPLNGIVAVSCNVLTYNLYLYVYFSFAVFHLFSCWHCQIKKKERNKQTHSGISSMVFATTPFCQHSCQHLDILTNFLKSKHNKHGKMGLKLMQNSSNLLTWLQKEVNCKFNLIIHLFLYQLVLSQSVSLFVL